MPIYVSAALVLHRRKEIMAAEPEMPVLHHLLNHIPENLDIEAVLRKARQLYNEYRPRMIQG
jgi:bifunctional DNase/RNase